MAVDDFIISSSSPFKLRWFKRGNRWIDLLICHFIAERACRIDEYDEFSLRMGLDGRKKQYRHSGRVGSRPAQFDGRRSCPGTLQHFTCSLFHRWID
jgi:hypothetical protein